MTTLMLAVLAISVSIAVIVEGSFQFANMIWYVFFRK